LSCTELPEELAGFSPDQPLTPGLAVALQRTALALVQARLMDSPAVISGSESLRWKLRTSALVPPLVAPTQPPCGFGWHWATRLPSPPMFTAEPSLRGVTTGGLVLVKVMDVLWACAPVAATHAPRPSARISLRESEGRRDMIWTLRKKGKIQQMGGG